MVRKNDFFTSPVWSIGFRPFFIMVLVLAIVPTSLWVLQFIGYYQLEVAPLLPNQWHANEMIFGFLLAAIIGFLLTASANWTGVRGIHGIWLFSFFLVFFATRILFWWTPFEHIWVYVIVGCLAPLTILMYLAQLFIKTNNKRNLILIAPLTALVIGQFLILNAKYVVGYELALYSVRFLIIVIAGRVIPFFTRKAIGLEPRWDFPILEKVNIGVAFLLILEPFYKGLNPVGSNFWLILTGLAMSLNTYRLINWRLVKSFNVQILFILYIAYLWLPIHFLLSILNYFDWTNDIGKGSLHSLSYGCMGLMIYGIIHRVTLGHTGRVIHANVGAVFGYVLLTLGATVRVFGPLLYPSAYLEWLKISGTLWVIAFLILSFIIVPKLLSPRVDGKEF